MKDILEGKMIGKPTRRKRLNILSDLDQKKKNT